MLAKMPHPPEFDALLDYLALSARELLAKHGELYPIAAVIDRSFGVAAFAIDEGDDRPDPELLLASLTTALREGALRGDYSATGTCVDVEIRGPGSDMVASGLSIRLDHVGGASLVVLVPYALVLGQVHFRDAQVTDGRHEIFPST